MRSSKGLLVINYLLYRQTTQYSLVYTQPEYLMGAIDLFTDTLVGVYKAPKVEWPSDIFVGHTQDINSLRAINPISKISLNFDHFSLESCYSLGPNYPAFSPALSSWPFNWSLCFHSSLSILQSFSKQHN